MMLVLSLDPDEVDVFAPVESSSSGHAHRSNESTMVENEAVNLDENG